MRVAIWASVVVASALRPDVRDPSRRRILSTISGGSGALLQADRIGASSPSWQSADYGQCARLPREIVLEVSSPEATMTFLTKALGMRAVPTTRGELAAAYGPVDLGKAPDFYPGVSSFDEEGFHCAIVLRRGPGSRPGDGVAYVQVAMPFIRASKIINNGGIIVDAYGVINVLAPGGLPFRLLVGDEVRDRLMYVALRCRDVKASARYYTDKLGMAALPYPRARPPTPEESPFDPNPPRQSAYLAYCPDTLGLLLISSPRNRVTGYNLTPDVGDIYKGITVAAPPDDPLLAAPKWTDPDGYSLAFVPAA